MHTLDEHASPMHLEERVIVSDVQRHRAALADAKKAYAKNMSSSVRFLIVENEHTSKLLQETKKREEQSTGSNRAKMNMAILS